VTAWIELDHALEIATGADDGIDALAGRAFGCPAEHFSGSVEACRRLVETCLPGWTLHLGFDVRGVFPYAALTRGGVHLEAEAPALPLAILKAAVKAAQAPTEAP
jgi:hypothetical protein